MILSPRTEMVLRITAVLLALVGLFRAPFAPAALALLIAVPPLIAVAWRRTTYYLAAAGACIAILLIAAVVMSIMDVPSGDLKMGFAFVGLLSLSSWAGWVFLSEAEERGHARRQVLEDLDEELAQLRTELGQQEKALTVTENRRKRYSRLQEAVTSLASTLELDRLADLTLAQTAQLLVGLKVDITVFVLDASGRELLRKEQSLGGGAPFPADTKVQEDALNAWVLAKGASLVIKDLEKDFRFRGLDMNTFAARSFHLSPLLTSQGQVAGLVRVESTFRDAMDQEDQRLLESLVVLASLAFENARLYREAQDLAVTDGLTRLLLRRPLMERLELEMQRAAEQSTPFSLVMVDIDHFSAVNNTYGHPAGDAVLREVAAILKRSVRDVDICGRYGGEEFVVLLPQTPIDGARLVAERIREAVRARSFELRGESKRVTISLGVATAPGHGTESKALIAAADEALYRSKNEGRDRVTLAGEVS